MTTKISDKNISNIANKFIQWQNVITASGGSNTAVAGEGYFIDTSSASHTLNLPDNPSIGDTVSIKDYAGTFATNNLTIGRNGNNIQGIDDNSEIVTNKASLTLVYVDDTSGWVFTNESNVGDLKAPTFITATGGTVTESGDFKIHTFTGDGCFVVSSLPDCRPIDGPSNVDYLVVAGGGSSGNGASSQPSGAGGAGGYRTSFPSPGCNAGSFPISATTYPIVVGAGGAGAPSGVPGNNGSTSTFSTITSAGGGYGGRRNVSSGNPGGSGGGGGASPCAAGTGNSPPVSPPQGNNGGIGDQSSTYYSGGGGGGASAAGTRSFSASPGTAGTGGAGSPNSISGSATFYAGGGGGFVSSPIGTGGSGGAGGGGQGKIGSDDNTPGTANTGGGGGAGSPAGSGGKGIVVIRYKYK